ncbi:hypothetical protein KJ810_04185 [Patescibacteria group bacterium]|nr:hypothetical protein [Patescibacteria group bacterium]
MKFFKNKPCWLKGGILALAVLLAWVLIYIIVYNSFGAVDDRNSTLVSYIQMFAAAPLLLLLIMGILLSRGTDLNVLGGEYGLQFTSLGLILASIMTLVIVFLVGASVGWIIGIVKTNKAKNNQGRSSTS